METELRLRVSGKELHPIHENLFGQFLEKPSWGGETGPEAALLPGTNRLILNTDYERQHRIQVQFDDLPVAGGPATLHRLRFLTRDEVRPGGAWTLPETDAVKVASAGMAVQVPCRSATVVVIPLQKRQPHE